MRYPNCRIFRVLDVIPSSKITSKSYNHQLDVGFGSAPRGSPGRRAVPPESANYFYMPALLSEFSARTDIKVIRSDGELELGNCNW